MKPIIYFLSLLSILIITSCNKDDDNEANDNSENEAVFNSVFEASTKGVFYVDTTDWKIENATGVLTQNGVSQSLNDTQCKNQAKNMVSGEYYMLIEKTFVIDNSGNLLYKDLTETEDGTYKFSYTYSSSVLKKEYDCEIDGDKIYLNLSYVCATVVNGQTSSIVFGADIIANLASLDEEDWFPLPVENLKVDYSGRDTGIELTWDKPAVDLVEPSYYEIYRKHTRYFGEVENQDEFVLIKTLPVDEFDGSWSDDPDFSATLKPIYDFVTYKVNSCNSKGIYISGAEKKINI